MNRALWRYGRSNSPAQQAAVMLYVHRLMADGAPGEADPKALSAASQSLYAAVERDAERFAGPYKVRAVLPAKLVAGREAEVTVEVLAADGRRVPNVDVESDARPAPPACRRRSARARAGVAKTTVTATGAASSADARRARRGLPAELPTLYVPTRGESARNAQRVVVAGDGAAERAGQGAGAGAAGALDPDQRADRRSGRLRSPTRSA